MNMLNLSCIRLVGTPGIKYEKDLIFRMALTADRFAELSVADQSARHGRCPQTRSNPPLHDGVSSRSAHVPLRRRWAAPRPAAPAPALGAPRARPRPMGVPPCAP